MEAVRRGQGLSSRPMNEANLKTRRTTTSSCSRTTSRRSAEAQGPVHPAERDHARRPCSPGFYAIVMAINGRFEVACIAVFCAAVLDSLDGRVARMTNSQSAFGEQMDSLSDMVSFGAAPALIVYIWALKDLGQGGLDSRRSSTSRARRCAWSRASTSTSVWSTSASSRACRARPRRRS